VQAGDPVTKRFPSENVPKNDRALACRLWDWMLNNASDHEDNATSLAESAAAHFEINEVGGPLDDPDHWIWDLAIEVVPGV
jgi:hypothetical protein